MNGFNEWRRKLMHEGHVPLPHDHFIRLLLTDMNREINKYAKNQHIPRSKEKFESSSQRAADIKEFKKLVKSKKKEAYAIS